MCFRNLSDIDLICNVFTWECLDYLHAGLVQRVCWAVLQRRNSYFLHSPRKPEPATRSLPGSQQWCLAPSNFQREESPASHAELGCSFLCWLPILTNLKRKLRQFIRQLLLPGVQELTYLCMVPKWRNVFSKKNPCFIFEFLLLQWITTMMWLKIVHLVNL